MKANFRTVPSSNASSAWVWPTTASVLPSGLPCGLLTLVRVPTWLQSTGLAVIDDVIHSVPNTGQRAFVAAGGGARMIGPAGGATAVRMLMNVKFACIGFRMPDNPTPLAGLGPKSFGLSMASTVVGMAHQYPSIPTLAVWWDDPDEDADGFYTGRALVGFGHVVVDAIGSDEGGPLLIMASRETLQDPLSFQRLTRR